jgi:hypothetical protein
LGTVDGSFFFHFAAHVFKAVPEYLVLVVVDLVFYYQAVDRLSFFVFLEFASVSCLVNTR